MKAPLACVVTLAPLDDTFAPDTAAPVGLVTVPRIVIDAGTAPSVLVPLSGMVASGPAPVSPEMASPVVASAGPLSPLPPSGLALFETQPDVAGTAASASARHRIIPNTWPFTTWRILMHPSRRTTACRCSGAT
jgi:hypothetical protein